MPDTKTPTSAARIEANRRNAQKSTGPRTEAGKAVSSLNGLTHGLRARAPMIPGEDSEALAARLAEWTTILAPRDGHESYHVSEAVHASWRIDRSRLSESAELARRARDAADLDDARRESDHARLLEELPLRPRLITPRLRRTALGCAWLLEQLQCLIEALDARGYWEPTEYERALHLLATTRHDLHTDPLAYDLTVAHLAITAATPNLLERLRHLHRMPAPPGMDDAEHRRRGERLAAAATEADPALARESLRDFLAAEHAQLADSLPALLDRDDLDRSEAPLRAACDVTPAGLLRARYEQMHRSAFRHALADLRRRQSDPAPDAPTKPNPPSPSPEPPHPDPLPSPPPHTQPPQDHPLPAPSVAPEPPAPTEPNLNATPNPATPPDAPPSPPASRFRDGSDPHPLPPEPEIPPYWRMSSAQLRACADEIERLALHENGLTPTPANLRDFADSMDEAEPYWTARDREVHIPPGPIYTEELERPRPRDMTDPRAVRAPYTIPPEQLDFIFLPRPGDAPGCP